MAEQKNNVKESKTNSSKLVQYIQNENIKFYGMNEVVRREKKLLSIRLRKLTL